MVLFWWTEHDVRAGGTYSARMAFMAPFTVALALDLLVHAPRLPILSITARDGLYMVAGIAAGVFNLGRYGAFAPGSTVRTPILAGLAAAAVYLGVVQIRKRRRK
jgi:hypothetical protein